MLYKVVLRKVGLAPCNARRVDLWMEPHYGCQLVLGPCHVADHGRERSERGGGAQSHFRGFTVFSVRRAGRRTECLASST